MSQTNLLDLSPDLMKIRPIRLTEDHVEQLAQEWRSCCCCHESLERQAVQMCCCDTIYHVHCLRGFAKYKALQETRENPAEFFCPWCNITLGCRPSDVWVFLDEYTVSAVLETGRHLDNWLTYLSKLDSLARWEFICYAEEHIRLMGNPKGSMQLPAAIHAIRKLCQNQPAAMEALETLYEERRTSFEALLEWERWLTCDGDLENQTELINAETIYGHGPNRFVPRIVGRLRRE